jgi:hypothetical protein
VSVPASDGRELVLTCYTQPEPELQLLLERLKLMLPAQLPPKITVRPSPESTSCVAQAWEDQSVAWLVPCESAKSGELVLDSPAFPRLAALARRRRCDWSRSTPLAGKAFIARRVKRMKVFRSERCASRACLISGLQNTTYKSSR